MSDTEPFCMYELHCIIFSLDKWGDWMLQDGDCSNLSFRSTQIVAYLFGCDKT